MRRKMIFSYWSEDDTSAVAPTIRAWSKHFPDYRMIGNDDIRPLLKRIKPGSVDLYDRIAIPACRSDVARLAYLYAHGGLYVDCHCHPADPEMIRRLLNGLDVHEMILLHKNRSNRDRPGMFRPRNGVIFARKSSSIISRLLDAAIDNLQRAATGQPLNIPGQYRNRWPLGDQNIWLLTGPGLYISMIADDPNLPNEIHPAYQHRIKMIEEADGPVRLYAYKGYRKLAPHWSVRQKSEPLFAPASCGPLAVLRSDRP